MKRWQFLLAVMVMWVLNEGKMVRAEGRCYETNGIEVCHDQSDESIFFDTPYNEIGYNVQTLRLTDKYVTVYHGEPFGKALGETGDSVKVAIGLYPYSYKMPQTRKYAVHGIANDVASPLYSVGTNPYIGFGGAANPMTVAGRYWAGDEYYYVFFIETMDSGDGDRQEGEADYKHNLYLARTVDFVNYEIKTGVNKWVSFSKSYCDSHIGECRPMTLVDVDGNKIVANKADYPEKTQGIAGSIALVNQTYYYFYSDYDEGGKDYFVWYRTASDVTGDRNWSSPKKVNVLGEMQMIRVGKAKGMNRWVAAYHCNKPNGALDICIQYTKNLNILGSGGLSELKLDASGWANGFNLGLKGSGEEFDSFGQLDWMTDRDGNPVSPDTEDNQKERGGEITWLDYVEGGNFKVYGGKVWRAGWTVKELIKSDANGDGKTDFIDFGIWKKEYLGQLTTKTADFNNDGKIDVSDYGIWKKGYLGL